MSIELIERYRTSKDLVTEKEEINPYRILIIGGSGSGKTYSLINLINQLLSNTPVIWMIFMRTLKNTTLMKNVKH